MSDSDRPFRPAGRFRSRLYGLLWRGSELLHRAGTACECLAAGVLRPRDLQAAMQRQFREFGASPDEVDEGLNPFEKRVYTRWLPALGRVLLVGSGAGRDLIGLTHLGYDVTGLEQSPELAESARRHLARHGITASVKAGFVETAQIERQYDAMVFAPSCYSNLRSSTIRIATLGRLRSHLSPGGRMFISYIPSVSQSRLAVALMRLTALLTSADWRPEAGDTFRLHHLAPGVLYFYHAFRPGEVARECAAAGLSVVAEECPPYRSHCIVLQIEGK
jgi:SAM-dependent methyltransferase